MHPFNGKSGFVSPPDRQVLASGLEFTPMSRPPQNLCLIDYFLSDIKQALEWSRFLAREREKERRSREILEFLARARQFPLRPHKLNQIRLLGKWGR